MYNFLDFGKQSNSQRMHSHEIQNDGLIHMYAQQFIPQKRFHFKWFKLNMDIVVFIL